MSMFIAQARAFIKDESGATAIEYGLIAGGIALAIVAALFAFGNELKAIFGEMETSLEGATTRIEEGRTAE